MEETNIDSEENFVHFGSNLRTLRKSKGMSQQDLAEALHITRPNVTSYELHNRQPRFRVLRRLREIFDVSLDDLYFRPLDQQSYPEKIVSRVADSDRITKLEQQLEELAAYVYTGKTPQVVAPVPIYNPIVISEHDDKGRFVQWSQLNIPSHTYLEISDGIYDRHVKQAHDILYDYEKVFIPYLPQLNFDQQRVLFNRSAKDSHFSRHYHLESETVICVEGRFHELVSDTIYERGESVVFAPLQPHEIRCLADSYLLVVLDEMEKDTHLKDQ